MILDLNLKTPTFGLLKKSTKILLDITRVGAYKKVILRLAVDNHVVDHCTIAIAHRRIHRIADRCIGDGINYEPIQKESCTTAKNMKVCISESLETLPRLTCSHTLKRTGKNGC